MAFYAFGLMESRHARAAADAAAAETGAALAVVAHEDVAALVQPVAEGPVRILRETLTAHTDVLQSAFRHGTVLPLRFGTIARDEQDLVERLLAPRAASLLVRLRELEGLAEMQVRASYLEEPLLLEILRADPELARTAERVRALPAEASHFDRIRMGEAIAAAVSERREQDANRILAMLSPLAEAVSLGEPRHERAVIDAAFLLTRVRVDEFDALVEDLSKLEGHSISFRLIGPMPAYSFLDGDGALEATGEERAWA